MYLIGIVGKAGSGKDTTAETLNKKDYKSIIKFATPIKELAQEFYDTNNASKEVQRRTWQSIGHFFRMLGDELYGHQNIWIHQLFKTIIEKIKEGVFTPFSKVFITDVRHLNEAEAIMSIGGGIIFLDVENEIRFNRLQKRDGISREHFDKMNQHISEIEIDAIKTYLVENSINHLFRNRWIFIQQLSYDTVLEYEMLVLTLVKNWLHGLEPNPLKQLTTRDFENYLIENSTSK